MRKLIAPLSVAAFATVGIFAGMTHADDAVPKDIQAIVDKIHQGDPPTEEEQKKLSDWQLRHRDQPLAGLTFQDVLGLVQKMRQTGKASNADIARIRAWAAEMAKHEAELRKDAERARGMLQPGGSHAPARSKPDLGDGTVHVRVTSRVNRREVSPGSSETVRYTSQLEVSYPAHFFIKDGGATGDLQIKWAPTGTAKDKHVTGGFNVDFRSEKTSSGREVDTCFGGFPIDEPYMKTGAFTDGELLCPAKGPRPWLYTMVLCPTNKPLQSVQTITDANGQTTTKSGDVPVTALPIAGISLDPGNEDAPLERTQVPPKTMPEYRKLYADHLPEEMKAIQSATCTFDAKAFRDARAAAQPFKAPLTYRYVFPLAKTEGSRTISGDMEVATFIELEFGSRAAELEIAPADTALYDKWLPVPFTKDEKVAKAFSVNKEDDAVTLSFKVGFTPKEGTSELPKGKIKLSWKDVSENKGVCCNYPPENAEAKKGLFFPPNQDGFEIDAEGTTATTKDEVSSLVIKVAARESGAYGKLVAECPDRGAFAVYKRLGTDSISIPKDDDGNHCADGWAAAQGLGPSWDEDPTPAGQRRNGDGYTTYEEYRGFIVLPDPRDPYTWKHVRTDPKKKDIFVWDKDLLIRDYYEPYNSTAAQLELHYVNSDLLHFEQGCNLKSPPPDHRCVNVNSSPADRHARQYAAYCLRDDTLKDANGPYEGGTQCYLDPPPKKDAGSFEQPLKYEAEMRINLACADGKIGMFEFNFGFKVPADKKAICIKNYRIGLVVHEFGHQIGIHHHFPEHVQPEKGPWKNNWPEVDSYVGWGVINCAMRYQATTEYDLNPLKEKGVWPALVRYCHNGEQAVPQKGPNYATDNGCWEQIDVKSDD